MNKLALFLHNTLDHDEVNDYTSTTDLAPPEQREINPRFAITQIHTKSDQKDRQTLQACYRRSQKMNTQPQSPGSKVELNLVPPELEDPTLKRKRKPQNKPDLVVSAKTTEEEYVLYREQYPLQLQTPQDDAAKEGRNVRFQRRGEPNKAWRAANPKRTKRSSRQRKAASHHKTPHTFLTTCMREGTYTLTAAQKSPKLMKHREIQSRRANGKGRATGKG